MRNVEEVPPLPSRLGGLEERSKLLQRGPGQSPGEKRFYRFVSVSERLSLRLLKINVVHSRPLVEKKMGLLNGYVLIH